jgi:peroxiredoxin
LRPRLAEFAQPAGFAVKLPEGADPRPEEPPLPQLSDDENNRKRQIENSLRPIDLSIAEVEGHLAVVQGDLKTAHDKLQQAGGVDPLYLARLQLLAGERDKALQAAKSAVDGKKNEVQPLASLVELLWLAGEQAEAQQRMTTLRELAGRADLDLPVLQRLVPVVQSLNLPADWRMPRPLATDVGIRPDLDSLGPYRWHPYLSPSWSLLDATGAERSSSQSQGRPTVVIFYLGYECLHCAQQLQAFAPLTAEFEKVGINLVAVSTDNAEGLKKSLENYKSGTFPFPLVSDPAFQTFKAFRAFDDFENKPLHGTFFIDGSGLVRWQDIGHEPFQDAQFVLKEAQRLLKLPQGQPMPGLQFAAQAERSADNSSGGE